MSRVEGPWMSNWKRMFRGSVREAREEMEARRWAYSWEFEVVVLTLGFILTSNGRLWRVFMFLEVKTEGFLGK